MTTPRNASGSITLIDAHVHLHSFADPMVVLDAAAENFQRAAHRAGWRDWQGVLLLAEMAGTDAFQELAQSAARSRGARWLITPVADEPASLLAENDAREILIVSGRQIATAEGLEVLALATREPVPDGRDLATTLGMAGRASDLVVLPWAVGKWLGRRGRLIRKALLNSNGSVFAGDNGGRPWLWPAPAAFRIARRFGRAVLPGSDPLPLAGEESRVGSRGFWLAWALPRVQPAAALCALLASAPVTAVHSYGAGENTARFVRNQIMLRTRPGVQRRKE